MFNNTRIKTIVRISLAVLCVPICLAGTCPTTVTPPVTTPTTLLSEMVASTAGAPVTSTPCAGAATGFSRTFNATAGKLVTIVVTGPTGTSRPQIQVRDILGNQVANTGATPTTQANTTTFTPIATNLFILSVNECAAIAAGSVYTVLVTQAP